MIPSDHYPRLKFGSFEDPDCATPCTSWCHDEIGFAYDGWCYDGGDAAGGSKVCIYFGKYSDAVMFLLRWSA